MEPIRIRAAVVAGALAGVSGTEPWASFDPADRASAASARERVRASGDRRRIAEAVVAERFAVMRAVETPCDPQLGAAFYARWMRAMDAPDRARLARSFDEHTAALVAAVAPRANAFDEPQRKSAAWLVAQGAQVLRRLPTATELAAVLTVLRGAGDVIAPALVRWERAIRVAGRREVCEAVARSLEVDR